MDTPPELPGVEHEYLEVPGLRTHVALAGPEDGPPVLLLHGWPQNWWAWRNVIPALAATHRVIAPDLRGHGWSATPVTGYAKEQLATDVLALLDLLDVQRVTWVGHDWGGWTGQLAAMRAPERIERLLVLCVPHLWVPPNPRQLALLGYQGPISLPFVGPWAARRMVPSILQSGRGDDKLPSADVDVFADHIPPEVTVAMYRTFLTRELLPIARGRYAANKLQMPTTVIVGARDMVTKVVEPGSVRGQPQIEVQRIDGVAHWVPEQRPEAVIDWVRKGSPPAPSGG